MFDTVTLAELTSSELLAAIEQNQRELVERENQLLLLAAAWADDQDRQPDDPFLISRRAVHGHHGGSELAVDAVLEFGALLGVGYVSAYAMIGDALQLRDRLPRIWDRVRAGSVRAWQARKVAQATTDLDAEAAADLDDALAGYLGQLPWPRFARLLQATVLQADPERLREREERARTERMVKAVDSDDGLKLLIARAASGDVIWFMATVNRMAEILQAEGDTDSVDVRRSKAIGILAAPARALDLLRRHAADPGDLTGQGEPNRDDQDQPEPAAPTLEDHENAPLPHDPAGTAEAEHVSLRSDLDPGIRLDPVAARPRAVVVFHLSESTFSDAGALVRPEDGGPLSLRQLHDFFADTGCHVTVRPVITPADTAPVDGYEIPTRVREAVRLRHIVDVFPYASSSSARLDLDHTRPWQPGGPPGQTGLHNLGPLSRRHHRAVTPGAHARGRWRKQQPSAGTYLWRSPHGYVYLTTNNGTLGLGAGPFARRVWKDAARMPATAVSPPRQRQVA